MTLSAFDLTYYFFLLVCCQILKDTVAKICHFTGNLRGFCQDPVQNIGHLLAQQLTAIGPTHGHELWHDIPQGNLSLFSSRKGQLIWIVFQKLVCFHSFYDLFLQVFSMFVEILVWDLRLLAFQRHLPRLSYPPFLNLRYSEIFGVLVVKNQSVVTLTLITSDLQPIFSRNRYKHWPRLSLTNRPEMRVDKPCISTFELISQWSMKEQGKNLLRRWTVPTVAQVIRENKTCSWQTLMGSPEQLLQFGSTFATWKTHVNNAYWTVSLCEQQLTLWCFLFFLCFFTIFRDFWRKEQT